MAKAKLSVREAVARLGCTRTYIYNLLCEAKLPGAYKHGRIWRIPAAAVESRLRFRETEKRA